MREGRRAVATPASRCSSDGREPRVLAVGEALPPLPGRARAGAACRSTSRARSRSCSTAAALDICHVHEPFAPSVASAALRHSRALNVGSFHAPTERVVSTQVARKVVQLVFGRLDARLASFDATRDAAAALLPRRLPGRRRPAPTPSSAPRAAGRRRSTIAFVEEEERAGAAPVPARAAPPRRRPRLARRSSAARAARRRARRCAPTCASASRSSTDGDEATRCSPRADVLVAASDGAAPQPGPRPARAGARAPSRSSAACRSTRRSPATASAACVFEVRDPDALAAGLAHLIADAGAARAAARARPSPRAVDRGRRRPRGGLRARSPAAATTTAATPSCARRLQARPLLDVDLHMHTDHSGDCATPVEVLLADRARAGPRRDRRHRPQRGLRRARGAQALAAEYGVKVIVAEEVKTASQGEVIGLFIEEKIPRGMTLAETVAEIRRQGGLVYVPHPFDRMHAVPDYEHLLDIVEDVDAIEVYNPRVAIGSFNEEAARFAAKYRIPAGAGSDAHVAQGLGSVRVRMRDFDGPEEFMESLRDADILTKPSSLLYVQALKFLQTKATPPAARRARRERRVRRATRKA